MSAYKATHTCQHCGAEFEAASHNAVYCKQECRLAFDRNRRRITPLAEKACELCGNMFRPRRDMDVTCGPECASRRYNESRNYSQSQPTTRRCRNKNCIERFIPTNVNHWWHEPACRVSEDQWAADEILAEEGALLPESTHLELAKRAFGQKNQALRKVSQLVSLRDYLTFEIRQFYDEQPERRFPRVPGLPKDSGKKGDREVIVQLSDWQIGKWEYGFGVEATLARIADLRRSLASIVQRQRDAGYQVRRIRPCFGGDMIEGCYIYRGQNVTGLDRTSNTHRLTTQIRTVAHEMAEFALFCATLADTVEVEVVGGNHGRTNGPNDYADPEDNFDVMAGWWAEDLTRATDRVKWNVCENWWTGFESMGHYIVSFHGDQWTGKFERLSALLPQWIASGTFDRPPELVLTHHRHTLEEKEIANAVVLQNGTIDGGSAWYLKQYGRASRPAQRIIVMSEKYAPESTWPVYFGAASVGRSPGIRVEPNVAT